MRQVLLTSAALLMSASVAALAQTTAPSRDGAPASRPAPMAASPAQPSHAVDQRAAEQRAADQKSQMTEKTQTTTMTPVHGGTFATLPPDEEMSSKIVGLEIYNSANKDIGKIKDIAFDQEGVKAYIVSVGGFLGMGDRYVAVNPSAVKISYDSNAKKWRAQMNTDVAELKAAPEYKYSSNE